MRAPSRRIATVGELLDIAVPKIHTLPRLADHDTRHPLGNAVDALRWASASRNRNHSEGDWRSALPCWRAAAPNHDPNAYRQMMYARMTIMTTHAHLGTLSKRLFILFLPCFNLRGHKASWTRIGSDAR